MKALIVYCTKTGHTEQAARDVARGLSSKGIEVDVREAGGVDPKMIKDFDILLVGTPTYGYRLYREAAAPVSKFMNSIPAGELKGKTAGAFAVNAALGGAKLVESLESKLSDKGASVVPGGPAVKAGSPLSLWKGPDATPGDVKSCEEYGVRVAEQAEKV